MRTLLTLLVCFYPIFIVIGGWFYFRWKYSFARARKRQNEDHHKPISSIDERVEIVSENLKDLVRSSHDGVNTRGGA